VKARRLAALTALTDARTERRRQRLEGVRAELATLRAQRTELAEHVRRYERETLGRGDGMALPLLVQRRAFVAQLVERVAELGEQVRAAEARVGDAASAYADALARGMALETLQRRTAADEALAAARDEQRRMDEAARNRVPQELVFARGDTAGALS